MTRGTIVEIELFADAERLRQLDLAILNDYRSNHHGHVPDRPTGVAVVRLLLKVSVKLPAAEGIPKLVTAVPVSQNFSPLGRVIIAL
jgi:hypothetical protein